MMSGRSRLTTYEPTLNLKPREYLLGHGRAADDVPSLQHQHAPAGAGEIRRRRQAIVSRSDDDRVVLCESLNFREWAGYYAVSAYETHHEHEYNAIRNACGAHRRLAALQVPRDRARRHAARRSRHHARRDEGGVGQVIYTPWCDERGKVIDDGTVTRLGSRRSGGPPRIRACGGSPERAGLDVRWRTSASRWPRSRCRGRPRPRCCKSSRRAHRRALRTFARSRQTSPACPWTCRAPATRAISGTRSGCRGQRGPRGVGRGGRGGPPFDLHPAGMLALDVARIEAGLLLIDVDFVGSRKALIDAQKYTPFELGLGAAGGG
jgi:aminomethyltransferase